MDLISRQAAIAVADSSDYVGLSVEDVKKVTDEVVKWLKQLPSAQPEIVRCKDCVWYKHDDCMCPHGMFIPDADDYCSCATRRTDESNV